MAPKLLPSRAQYGRSLRPKYSMLSLYLRCHPVTMTTMWRVRAFPC
jgi:hypothetical protein